MKNSIKIQPEVIIATAYFTVVSLAAHFAVLNF